jgi:hypothetical protein
MSRLADDDVRTAIDISVASTLGLPDLTRVREMLSQEPVLTNRPLLPKDVPETVERPQMEILFA